MSVWPCLLHPRKGATKTSFARAVPDVLVVLGKNESNLSLQRQLNKFSNHANFFYLSWQNMCVLTSVSLAVVELFLISRPLVLKCGNKNKCRPFCEAGVTLSGEK